MAGVATGAANPGCKYTKRPQGVSKSLRSSFIHQRSFVQRPLNDVVLIFRVRPRYNDHYDDLFMTAVAVRPGYGTVEIDLSNALTNLNLSDMEVCYKVFKREILQGIELKEDRFGFEPEFTAKIARRGYTFYEVGISYYGRTYEEGKKINWKDGLRAIYVILKYGLFR